MKNHRFFCTLGILAFLLLTITTKATGQANDSLVVVSKLVGPQISVSEFKRFTLSGILLPTPKNLDYLEIWQKEDKNYYMQVHLTDGEEVEKYLPQYKFVEAQEKINRLGATLLKRWEQIRNRLENNENLQAHLELSDGSRVNGKVLALEGVTLYLQSLGGEVQFLLENLHKIVLLSDEEYDKYTSFSYPNPNATRYLFSPSAIPLDKGTGYYQNIFVGLNSFSCGVTDHVSLSGGLELFSTLASIFVDDYLGAIGYVNVKASTPIGNKIYVGGGAIMGGMLAEEGGSVIMGYTLFTYGNKEHNVTLGGGWSFINGQWSRRLNEEGSKKPTLNLGAMTRVGKNVSLVTENWFTSVQTTRTIHVYDFPSRTSFTGSQTSTIDYLAISGAIRIMNPKVSFDLGLVSVGYIRNKVEKTFPAGPIPSGTSFGETDWIPFPIPYIDFVYTF